MFKLRRSRRLALEVMEDRTAPAVLTWTGAGDTPKFSDARNWGGRHPHDGDSLVFGPQAAQSTANNNLVNAHFRSIQFNDDGYTLTGRGLSLRDGITASAGASGLNTVRLNVTLSSPRHRATFDVGADAQVRIDGQISSPRPVIVSKTGAGTLTLGGRTGNTFVGRTIVAEGTLEFDKAAGRAIGGNLSINAGATVNELRDDQIPDLATVTIGRTAVINLNGQDEAVLRVMLAGGSITTGAGTLQTQSIQSDASDVSASISGNLDLAGGFRPINVNDGPAADDLVISAAIHIGGWYKTGPGKLVLSGDNDYTGITALVEGTVEIRSNTALGGTQWQTEIFGQSSLVLGGNITLAEPLSLRGPGVGGGGALQAVGVNNVITSAVQLPKAATVGTAPPEASLRFSGVISGPGRLTKVGLGTVLLAGINDYAGTVVAGGTLAAVNTTGLATAAPITVNKGGTLAGSGAVATVSVTSGGAVAPGAPIGPLTTGDIGFTVGAIFRADLDQAPPNSDLLNVVGTVNLGGAILVLNPIFSSGILRSYTLIANDGTDPTVGTFTGPDVNRMIKVSKGGFEHTYRVDYNVEDGDVLTDGNDVVLTRTSNYTPISQDTSATTAEDTLVSGQLVATDIEGDPLTYSLVTPPSNGSVVSFNMNTGAFTYRPDADFFGTDSFTFRANDGIADGAPATVTITVTEVNDAPAAVNDTIASSPEDTVYTILGSALTANDSPGPREGSQTLTVVSVTNVVGGTAVVDNGDVFFTPTPDYNGPAGFDYTVRDDGTTNGVPDPLTASASVSFNVTPVNDPPVAVGDVGPTVAEDSGLVVITGASLTANDSRGPADESGQTLSVVSVGNFVGGTAVVVGGNVQFTLTANFNGTASFDYTVRDNGTTNGAADPQTDVGHVTFTVTPVNDAPVAVNDTVSGNEDTAITGNVLNNDTDIDLDVLTVVRVNGVTTNVGTPVAIFGGTVTVNANGFFTFNPNANFNGTTSFTYVANDGAADSNLALVTIVVNPVNDPPVVTTSTTSRTYTLGTLPIPIDPNIALSDIDDVNLESATVHIANSVPADILAFDPAALPSGVGFNYDPTAKTLTFTGTATVAEYQALLQTVTFTTSGAGSGGDVEFDFTVSDGDANGFNFRIVTVQNPILR